SSRSIPPKAEAADLPTSQTCRERSNTADFPVPLAPNNLLSDKDGWCPSIACMKYAQRAHAHCILRRHGTRSTSGVRHLPQSSGDGGLRAGCRERRNSLTRGAPWPKVIRCPEPHPNEGLDRPTMSAGMTDEAWIMEALLSHSVPHDFHA